MDRYAVIGNPISQSKSPLIHTRFALEAGENLSYEALLAPLDGFIATVNEFRANGGRGMNVTAPFKLEAYAMATDRTERARLAGAVNALKFEDDSILAENFDGLGLVNDIQRNLGFPLQGRRVLLMGAGGAARGAILPFLEQKADCLVIVNRHVDKAANLAEQFSSYGQISSAGYDALSSETFDIVINATSASLHDELPPLPKSVFAENCLAYELAYGKGLTPFLRVAREAGVKHLADGVGMLVEQAAEAFMWWRRVRPETKAMIAAMTVPLV